VLAAAEADLQPEFRGAVSEGGQGIGGVAGMKAQAGQRLVDETLLARPERVAALAPVESVGRRLEGADQRPKAVFSAGTRSVSSQVKVPLSTSGSRPKWP